MVLKLHLEYKKGYYELEYKTNTGEGIAKGPNLRRIKDLIDLVIDEHELSNNYEFLTIDGCFE